MSGRTIFIGIDFGLTPAAVFGQTTASGQWRWIDELVTEDIGAVRFAELLGPMLRGRYAGFEKPRFLRPTGFSGGTTNFVSFSRKRD